MIDPAFFNGGFLYRNFTPWQFAAAALGMIRMGSVCMGGWLWLMELFWGCGGCFCVTI